MKEDDDRENDTAVWEEWMMKTQRIKKDKNHLRDEERSKARIITLCRYKWKYK